MTQHKVATSKNEWNAARKALLEREKAYTRQGDELAAARRALPWLKVDRDYRFQTGDGEKSLAELFGAHHQLIVYHFMFHPDWEVACKSCSFWSDHFAPTLPHLAARDVSLVAVSRAPLAKLEAFAKRMGWTHPLVSSFGSEFNYDFDVSFTEEQSGATYNFAPKTGSAPELPGLSAFYKDDAGAIWHTYSAYGRGVETVNTTYRFLDLAPRGRDEDDLEHPMAWLRLKDEYDG
ncbi:MAG: DUF899 domain-containing protein [Deltaproteobacteria bacterium]